MHKETKDKHFIKKPTYPGGLKAMQELIRTEMKYPKSALEHKIEGTIVVKYEVDHKGNVSASKVINTLGHGCDEEAIRLVSLFKFIIPKNPRKLRVKFNKTIKIHFKLPKEQPKPKSPKKVKQTITYNITTNPKEQSTPKHSDYSYTIKY